MNRREFIGSVSAGVIGVSRALPVAGQGRAMAPDLAAMADEGRLVLVDRTATRLVDGTRTAVRLSRALGETVAFLPDLQFANGTIGLDIRGANLKQQSFVGVAFTAWMDRRSTACSFAPSTSKLLIQ